MLVAHYRLNDSAASTVVADSSGNANTGTAARNTNLMAAVGKVGGALDFNGTTDVVVCTINFMATLPASVFAWMFLQGAGGASFGRIFDNGLHYLAANTVTNSLWFGNLGTANGTISQGAWYHVGVVWTSSTVVKIYINGALAASGNPSVSQGTNATYLGNNNSSLIRGLNGLIDDVRIYNEALAVWQVAAIYNNGNGSPLPYPWLASQRGLLGVLGAAA